MIQIPKDNMIDKCRAFTVHDAETGDEIESWRGERFMLDGNGTLYELDGTWHDGWGKDVILIEKEGKYLIQFGDGKYMRW